MSKAITLFHLALSRVTVSPAHTGSYRLAGRFTSPER